MLSFNLKKGPTPKIRKLYFVVINSVLCFRTLAVILVLDFVVVFFLCALLFFVLFFCWLVCWLSFFVGWFVVFVFWVVVCSFLLVSSSSLLLNFILNYVLITKGLDKRQSCGFLYLREIRHKKVLQFVVL